MKSSSNSCEIHDHHLDASLAHDCAVLASLSSSEAAQISRSGRCHRAVKLISLSLEHGVQIAKFRYETNTTIVAFMTFDEDESDDRSAEDPNAVEFPEANLARGSLVEAQALKKWRQLTHVVQDDDDIIVFTGFGFAASLSAIASSFHSRRGVARVQLLTFGPSLVGNKFFLDTLASRVTSCHRVILERDYTAHGHGHGHGHGYEHREARELLPAGDILHLRRGQEMAFDAFYRLPQENLKPRQPAQAYVDILQKWNGKVYSDGTARSPMQVGDADPPHKQDVLKMAELSNAVYFEEDVVKEMISRGEVSASGLEVSKVFSDGAGADLMIFSRYNHQHNSNDAVGEDIVVSIRGSSSVQHVLADLSLKKVEFQSVFGVADEARVHEGFASLYDLLSSLVLLCSPLRRVMSMADVVCEFVRSNLKPNARLYICGHSLGGACAILLSLYLQTELNLRYKQIHVFNFGAPRACNARVQSVFRSLIPNCYRVVAGRDVISFAMAEIYKHVGQVLHFQNGDGVAFTSVVSDGVEDWSSYSVSDHQLATYLERIRQWDSELRKPPHGLGGAARPADDAGASTTDTVAGDGAAGSSGSTRRGWLSMFHISVHARDRHYRIGARAPNEEDQRLLWQSDA